MNNTTTPAAKELTGTCGTCLRRGIRILTNGTVDAHGRTCDGFRALRGSIVRGWDAADEFRSEAS